MPSFGPPSYSKITNPQTSAIEPCYTFTISLNNEDTPSFIANTSSEISDITLNECIQENRQWWNIFISHFLNVSAKLFSKPYTVDNINKIVKHIINTNSTIHDEQFPANVLLIPKSIQILGGKFIVHWYYDIVQMIINIPDLDESVQSPPVLNTINNSNGNENGNDSLKKSSDIEELDVDKLPESNDSTDEVFQITSPAKFYDKQRVKEARLKAKLAVYKAQRQIAKYYDKYGDDDISETDTDYDTSDNDYDSEEDEEGDEIQD
jgi:hypothetical protein